LAIATRNCTVRAACGLISLSPERQHLKDSVFIPNYLTRPKQRHIVAAHACGMDIWPTIAFLMWKQDIPRAKTTRLLLQEANIRKVENLH
jgi:hypothetical protein